MPFLPLSSLARRLQLGAVEEKSWAGGPRVSMHNIETQLGLEE